MSDLDPRALPAALDVRPGIHDVAIGLVDGPVVDELARHGWATATVNLGAAATKADILEAFARGLGFPDWVGRNWDALDDALDDLSWWPSSERGRLLVVRGVGRVRHVRPDDGAVLVDVLGLAAGRWAETDTPLVVLLEA